MTRTSSASEVVPIGQPARAVATQPTLPWRAPSRATHAPARGRESEIHDRAPEHALRATALANGMLPLRRDGARWLADGTTSLAELVRVTRET